jgi:hypothetical protein
MRAPFRLVLVLLTGALVTVTPLIAQNRGDVLVENRENAPSYGLNTPGFNLWLYGQGYSYTVQLGQLLVCKIIPYLGPGHFLIPATTEWIFHDGQTVSVWDGVCHNFMEPGKGYNDIFTDDTELSEIAPMRSGNFLVAERSADAAHGAKLIEFNLQARVADFTFPQLLDPMTNRALGAMHIELLADQCTVLYTLGNDDPAGNRVRRLNICTQQPQPDFASLVAGQYEGAIRQLPNGDVLVANGSAILQFSAQGALLRSYQFPGVTHLALTPDGSAFWAAGVALGTEYLWYFDPSTPDGHPKAVQFGGPGSMTIMVPLDISDLVVIGEWRAALTSTRPRAVRRR